MSKEAMKLALEALEHMLEDAKQERLTVEYWNECVDAITTLQEALAEQPAQQEPVALKPCWYESKEKTMCRKCGQIHAEAISPAQQEPVAWAHKEGLESIKDFDASIYANGGFDDAVPLYTSPPAQKECEKCSHKND